MKAEHSQLMPVKTRAASLCVNCCRIHDNLLSGREYPNHYFRNFLISVSYFIITKTSPCPYVHMEIVFPGI